MAIQFHILFTFVFFFCQEGQYGFQIQLFYCITFVSSNEQQELNKKHVSNFMWNIALKAG